MKRKNTTRMIVSVLFLLVLFCACVSAFADSEPALHFENGEINIPVKKAVKVLPVAENIEKPKALKYTWTSSDEQVAAVQNGTVRGIETGEAVITCAAELPDGKQVSCSLKVHVVEPVKSVVIRTKANTKVNAGETLAVDYEVLPDNATDKSLTWESSDPRIATVDSAGTVTAVSAGKVTITAVTNDGSKKQAKVMLYIPSLQCGTDRVVITEPEGASFEVGYFGEDWERDVTVKATGNPFTYQTEQKENKAVIKIDGGILATGKIEIRDKKDPAGKVTVDVEIYPDEMYRQGLDHMKEEKFYSAYKEFNSSSSDLAREKEKECIRPWPRNGEIWRDSSVRGKDMRLILQANQNDDTAMLFRVIKDGKTVSCLFVGGTGKAIANLPGGVYTIKDGAGTQWFGMKEAFGPDGSYETMTFEDDQTETLLESGYIHTITINVQEANPDAEDVGSVSEGWSGFAE